MFWIFLCRKKIFLHAKIIKNENWLVYEQFSGCSKLGHVFQVRFFYGTSRVCFVQCMSVCDLSYLLFEGGRQRHEGKEIKIGRYRKRSKKEELVRYWEGGRDVKKNKGKESKKWPGGGRGGGLKRGYKEKEGEEGRERERFKKEGERERGER